MRWRDMMRLRGRPRSHNEQAKKNTENGAVRPRLSVFILFLPLLMLLLVMISAPTMAWVSAQRHATLHSGVLMARHTDFQARVTILPCDGATTDGDHALADDVMFRDMRYTSRGTDDAYEVCVTVRNRASRDKSFELTLDNLSLQTEQRRTLSTALFWFGVPTAAQDGMTYYAETAPVLVEDGWQYFPCTVLTDGAPVAAAASLAAGAEVAIKLRVRLDPSVSTAQLQTTLENAVFRIGQISVRDTTPKGG